jgi:hypothetical protein
MILSLAHFAAKYRVAVNDIRQYHRQDDDHSPKGEAQGFMLCHGLLEGEARGKDIRIKRGNKAKISCEKKEDTTHER